MAIFYHEGVNFTDIKALGRDIVDQMLANGFTKVYPSVPLVSGDTKILLESSATVDPVFATQPYRVYVDCDTTYLKIILGTSVQLPNSGTVAPYDYFVKASSQSAYNTAFNNGQAALDSWLAANPTQWVPKFWGEVGIISSRETVTPAVILNTTGFYDRNYTIVGQNQVNPSSYRLAISNHGFSLFIWEPGSEGDPVQRQSWLTVQRPVNNANGLPLATGEAPLFCLFYVTRSGTETANGKMVVREASIFTPSDVRSIFNDSVDSARIMNGQNMVAVTEDNKYAVYFPNQLNTNRFAYPSHELDQIVYTSADVIGQNADISITIYGEAQPRVYRAMPAAGANSTGIRTLLWVSGGPA